MHVTACSLMEGMDIGRLIGGGPSGPLYLAYYQGQRCAVKVVTNTEHMRLINGMPLEAVVTQVLRHPCLLSVIALSGQPAAAPPADAGREAGGGAAAAGGGPAPDGSLLTAAEPSAELSGGGGGSGSAALPRNILLWDRERKGPQARWLMMEYADGGRLSVSFLPPLSLYLSPNGPENNVLQRVGCLQEGVV